MVMAAPARWARKALPGSMALMAQTADRPAARGATAPPGSKAAQEMWAATGAMAVYGEGGGVFIATGTVHVNHDGFDFNIAQGGAGGAGGVGGTGGPGGTGGNGGNGGDGASWLARWQRRRPRRKCR